MGKKSKRRSYSDDEDKENRWKKRFKRLEEKIEQQNDLILHSINRGKLIVCFRTSENGTRRPGLHVSGKARWRRWIMSKATCTG